MLLINSSLTDECYTGKGHCIRKLCETAVEIKGKAFNLLLSSMPPLLWTDLVKILTRKPIYTSSFTLECTDIKGD